LIFRKVFFFYFGRKTLSRNCEKFRNIILLADYVKFSPQTFDCYLFCLNLFFLISSLKIWFNLIFILTSVLIFMTIIYFSLVIFLIEIFYHQIWSSFHWLLPILFKIIYEIVIIIILISSSFNFFYLLNLISIILIIIYFIWDNLWNYIFFSISLSFNFLIVRFIPYYFNKLEKK